MLFEKKIMPKHVLNMLNEQTTQFIDSNTSSPSKVHCQRVHIEAFAPRNCRGRCLSVWKATQSLILGPRWNAGAPGLGIHQVRQQSSLTKDPRNWNDKEPWPFAHNICFIQTLVSFGMQEVSRSCQNKVTVKKIR